MGKDRVILHLPVPGKSGEYVDVERRPANVDPSSSDFPGEPDGFSLLPLGVLTKELKHPGLQGVRLPVSTSSSANRAV